MKSIEVKTFDTPDEIRTFDKGKLEPIEFNGRMAGRATLEPGWKWSQSVKPLAQTESCLAPHFQYHLSGTIHVKMDDGTERDSGRARFRCSAQGMTPGWSAASTVVLIDFQGMVDYDRKG